MDTAIEMGFSLPCEVRPSGSQTTFNRSRWHEEVQGEDMRADDRRRSALQADCHQAEAQVCPRLGGCLLVLVLECLQISSLSILKHGKPHGFRLV